MFTRSSGRVGAVALAIAGMAVVAGCGSNKSGGNDAGGGGGKGKAVNVAFLSYVKSDYTTGEEKGVKSVVEASGGSLHELISNFDPSKQVAQCQDAITSKRYNAIVIVPLDPATPIACVRAAHAAGIPVGTLETAVGKDPYSLKPQEPGVVAVVSAPLQSQVDADAQLIEQACGAANPCEIIAEVATANDPFTNQAVAGVATKLGSRVKIVQKIASQYDPGALARALPDVLSAHPGTDVIYSISDQSALAAAPALKSAKLASHVKIVGRGGSSEGAAGVKSGALFGTTGNWPIQNGAFLGRALTEAVNGQPVKEQSLDILKTDTPVIVTKDTVDQFKPEWGSRN
jgi:ribose transport system substrate-binding protein